MAVPAFWATPFSYQELQAVTDVATVITALNAQLLALGWTDQSGTGAGPWKTPARADGVFFRIGAVRTSATRITWTMYDQAGLLVMGSGTADLQDIEATGCPVQIYAGTLHLAVNSQRATPEAAWFCVLDQTPDVINIPRAVYMCTQGPRTSDGTLRNYTWGSQCYSMPPGSTSYASQGPNGFANAPAGACYRKTAAGTALITSPGFGDYSKPVFWGRIPQCIAIDQTGLSFGSEVTAPIDAGVNAVFKVIGVPASFYQYIAFRKS